MVNYLLKGILAAIAVKVLDNYRHLSVQMLRIEAAKSYLCGIRTARLSAMGIMLLQLVIALICLGVLLFHIGLFLLLPWSMKAKAVLGMVLGLAYVVTGGLVLRKALDEKTWIEKSGAAKMLAEVARHR